MMMGGKNGNMIAGFPGCSDGLYGGVVGSAEIINRGDIYL